MASSERSTLKTIGSFPTSADKAREAAEQTLSSSLEVWSNADTDPIENVLNFKAALDNLPPASPTVMSEEYYNQLSQYFHTTESTPEEYVPDYQI